MALPGTRLAPLTPETTCRRVLWVSARGPCEPPSQLGALHDLHTCSADEPLNLAVARACPDVAVFELDPRDVRALAALRLARLEHPELPALVVSEDHWEELALAALRLKVWDLLVKPLAPGKLEAAIAACVGSHRAAASPRMANADARQRPLRRERSTYPALAFISSNLQRRLSLADCARACNLSPCEFSRRFHAEHGVSFSEYLLRQRVERAAALLAHADRSVSEAAYAAGFNDLSYFARVFRRFVGMPASAYRDSVARPASFG
jgi:two-component system response regulator YesN